jgi:hypothetical protein
MGLTMMRLVMQYTHQEVVQMRRLSVSLDDDATEILAAPPLNEWRRIMDRAVAVLPAEDASCFVVLRDSLQELSPEPSSAAVVRKAVDVYLDLLRQAHDRLAMRDGYQALAMDSERNELVEVMSKRAPERWAAEG